MDLTTSEKTTEKKHTLDDPNKFNFLPFFYFKMCNSNTLEKQAYRAILSFNYCTKMRNKNLQEFSCIYNSTKTYK